MTVNLRRHVEPFAATEYRVVIGALEGSRRRLGLLLCGYALMSDHWHALIRTDCPLDDLPVIHDVKKISARRLLQRRGLKAVVAAPILEPV